MKALHTTLTSNLYMTPEEARDLITALDDARNHVSVAEPVGQAAVAEQSATLHNLDKALDALKKGLGPWTPLT